MDDFKELQKMVKIAKSEKNKHYILWMKAEKKYSKLQNELEQKCNHIWERKNNSCEYNKICKICDSYL